ncbi:Transcriptional regulatory protein DegU [Pigmentiphaga humi]|uniref:Transcriptional regulatory protein DegU n=1 Tax=Pigmentiphaga humi TaxID=2478468 RepID=A0A3P4B0K2_9BURK|nr:response regulator transcription factor [Pigmentiphaga humi]VCU69260.1 Transcriptional regulatory protein DegU [Pigmentiphaga humi]
MKIEAPAADPLRPVLLLTQDDELWRRWQKLNQHRWLAARGKELADLSRWQRQGRRLAILDGSLPRLPAWDSAAWPAMLADTHLIVTSSQPAEDEAARALMGGASGYCHTYAPVETLASALEAVSTGGVWLGQALMSSLLRQIDARSAPSGDWSESLTQRESRVARLAAGGHTNPRIATALGITERTVRAHLSSIFEKLGVGDRLQLALRVHGVTVPADA